jgi:hypothetical protein
MFHSLGPVCAFFCDTCPCSHSSCEILSLHRDLQAPEVLEPLIGTPIHVCALIAILIVPQPIAHVESYGKVAGNLAICIVPEGCPAHIYLQNECHVDTCHNRNKYRQN